MRITWRTETEDNAFGFYVYRAEAEDGVSSCLNPDAPVGAAGITARPQQYVYYDLDVRPESTYWYRLEQVDLDGSKGVVIGAAAPVAGEAKPLTDAEAAEIARYGRQFRLPANGAPD